MPTGIPLADSASGSEIAGSPVMSCSHANAFQSTCSVHDLLRVSGPVEVTEARRLVGHRRGQHRVIRAEKLRGAPPGGAQTHDRQWEAVHVAAGIAVQTERQVVQPTGIERVAERALDRRHLPLGHQGPIQPKVGVDAGRHWRGLDIVDAVAELFEQFGGFQG